MRLTLKCVTAFTLLLCLSASGCSRSDDAASGSRQTLSNYAPSPQSENTQPTNENAQPENEGTQPKVESPLPPPKGFVNDYANVFDAESETRLESALRELRDKSDVEFAVVTIETTGDRPIFDYSLDVARGWGVGRRTLRRAAGCYCCSR